MNVERHIQNLKVIQQVTQSIEALKEADLSMIVDLQDYTEFKKLCLQTIKTKQA